MSNEQLVEMIKNEICITDNMKLLYYRNLGLIKKFIKPYESYEKTEDLLQEAYFGLWNAVQHYESSEHVLFMTYARYWIVQAVRKYIDDVGSVVRIPSYEKQKIIQYKKKQQEYIKEYGRTPTDKELSEYMCVSVAKIEEYKRYSIGISSIDTPLAEDSEETLTDTLKDDFRFEDVVLDNLYGEQLKMRLWDIIKCFISDSELEIIKGRFLENKTLQILADEKNISRERVRQLEESALKKLKRESVKNKLMHEVAERDIYRTGFNRFIENDFTSTVEKIAIQKNVIASNYQEKIKSYLESIEQYKMIDCI